MPVEPSHRLDVPRPATTCPVTPSYAVEFHVPAADVVISLLALRSTLDPPTMLSAATWLTPFAVESAAIASVPALTVRFPERTCLTVSTPALFLVNDPVPSTLPKLESK